MVGYGKTFTSNQRGIYNIVYSYLEERVGMEAGKIAVDVIHHIAGNTTLDLPSRIEDLGCLVDDLAYGLSTQALVDEATRRDIPVIRLNEANLVQLGYGIYQKRIQATVTSQTNHISVDIAADKAMTKQLLSDIGIPVPKGSVVDTWKDAKEAIARIEYPVVMKPLDGNHGRGVAINVNREKTAFRSFKNAKRYNRRIIVEEFIRGRDYRILVINGQVVAAAERIPARVFGDGIHTVRQLVEMANRDPQRGVGHEKALSRILIDEESKRLLKQQSLGLESIPVIDQEVRLKYTANVSTGGTAIDCTDDLHFTIRDMAVRAAKAVGLDVAGIDLITSDITRSLEETRGGICELNAAPGFRMHLYPYEGTPRNVASPVIDMLFPSSTPSRIPIVAITGTNGKTTTARMLAHILKMAGRKVGLTSTDGIFIDGRKILSGDLTGPWSAQVVLKDPTVDFAVIEAARGGILRAGLGFDQCDVGAIMNVREDHLGQAEIETIEELAYVKALILEVVKDSGYSLINADDPNILRLRDRYRGQHFYFSLDKENEVLREHLRQGGYAIYLDGDTVKLSLKKYELPVINVRAIPATFRGAARFNIANALVAIAAAYCTGAKIDDISAGLKTFQMNYYLSPGRMNFEEVNDFTVLLDYAHNAPALEALCEFLFNGGYARRIGVIATPGDRRNEDILAFGRVAGTLFHQVIIKEDYDLRGRAQLEVAELLKEGFLSAGRSAVDAEILPDEADAVEYALEIAQRDDLVVICCDKIADVWNRINAFKERRAPSEAGELLSKR